MSGRDEARIVLARVFAVVELLSVRGRADRSTLQH
jgi:hypothetical protein